MDYNLYPKREHQLKWIAVYLEEAAKLRGKYTCMHEQNTLSVKISEMPTFLKELKSWSLQRVNLLGPKKKILKVLLCQFNQKCIRDGKMSSQNV